MATDKEIRAVLERFRTTGLGGSVPDSKRLAAALAAAERERDEAESDMAAANITIRRLSAKLAVVVDAANDLDRETIVTEDGQREVVDQAAVIRLEDAIADLPTAARKLLDEVEALRADRERLDFIGQHCGGDGVLDWHFGTSGKVRICVGNDYQDLRAAIDAARKGEQ